jgi:hypothetical protein
MEHVGARGLGRRVMVLHCRATARVVGQKLESWPSFVCATALVRGIIFPADDI